MKIWIDSDSCPGKVRTVIARAAARLKVHAFYIANHQVPIEENDFVEMIVVDKGEGVADDYICNHAQQGDLAVTRDIPLAARLLELDIVVLNDRGTHFTGANIGQRLAMRDLMKELRESGYKQERHSVFSNKELQKFASLFDRELTRLLKSE